MEQQILQYVAFSIGISLFLLLVIRRYLLSARTKNNDTRLKFTFHHNEDTKCALIRKDFKLEKLLQKNNDLAIGLFEGTYGRKCTDCIANVVSEGLKDEMYFSTSEYLTKLFKRANEEFGKIKLSTAESNSGCSGALACILNRTLFVANLGDVEGVLINRVNNSSKYVTKRHTLEDSEERERVLENRGTIIHTPGDVDRIGGIVKTTRNFGNLLFKKWVSDEASIYLGMLRKGDSCLVLGNSLFWEGISPSQLVWEFNKISSKEDCLEEFKEKIKSINNSIDGFNDVCFVIVDLRDLETAE
eukprot:GAHX01002211.1.p1 GENE.GAHX01002211.1~~GAHX01002211.1.p1  ORF type:complete len:301 (-),score=56.67 GAHX01002211.1:37-939(-)